MPVKQITTPLGHSLPPASPHNITFHLPGWDSALRFRDGDPTIASQLKSIYPRFAPWGLAKELCAKLAQFLQLAEGHACFAFVNPDIFAFAAESSTNAWRRENKLAEGELGRRVVDVGGTRLYVLTFPMRKYPGVKLAWINPGTGVTTRLAEALLPALERGDVREVEIVDGRIPEPSWLEEGEPHGAIRRRIVGLLRRAPLDGEKAALVKEDDVFLYPTGMASIWWMHNYLQKWRPGTAVFVGSVFHNTFHLLQEAPGGYKHFGKVDGEGKGLDELESYLESEAKEGRKISYLFLEFPSNPILVSADLKRLRQLVCFFSYSSLRSLTIHERLS
jgi:cystathionine gamma-synthase